MKTEKKRRHTGVQAMIVRKIGKPRKAFQYFCLNFTQKFLNQLIANSFIVKINAVLYPARFFHSKSLC